MSYESISAVCATSSSIERKIITFDTQTGLICDVSFDQSQKVDHFFDDHCLLFASIGDVHVHAREDMSGQHCYKEDFNSASRAALHGGVHHFCDMPNNPIPPIDDQSYLEKLHLTSKAEVNILCYAGIGPTTHPLTFAVPYKLYMGPSIGDLFFERLSDIDIVLKQYQGESVSFHCEDPEILQQHSLERTHLARRPIEAEVMATHKALELIEKFRLKGKLCHYSASDGLKAIQNARSRGIDVKIEVTPQHLIFCDEELNDSNRIWMQMNPPIRSRKDREIMLDSVLKGEIDFLATDHAPHSLEEKSKGHSGMTGLDTYALAMGWLLKKANMDPRVLAKMVSENPGDFVNPFIKSLAPYFAPYLSCGLGFGRLEKDFMASFTVINLSTETHFNNSMIQSKAKSSPFIDFNFPCSVQAVFLKGKKKIQK